jgi:cytochrome d ubiquinol oxidase subunit I
VAKTQPEKLASFEGLFETQKRAPALLFGIPDASEGKIHAAVEVPWALSIMISGDPDYEVKGLNDFPPDERPPLGLTFVPFHLMFYLGMYFIGFTGLGILLLWRKKLYSNKLFMKLAFFSIPLPIITNELGWIAAEVGRQPWIVYRVPGMRTSQAVSISVTAGEILASIIMFSVIYTLLFFLWIYLLRRAVRKGPEDVTKQEVAS